MSPAEKLDRWSDGGMTISGVAVSGVRGFWGGWTLKVVMVWPRFVRREVRGWHSFREASQLVQEACPVRLLA